MRSHQGEDEYNAKGLNISQVAVGVAWFYYWGKENQRKQNFP